MIFKLLLEEVGLIEQLLLGQLFDFHESLGHGAVALLPRRFQNYTKELLVQVVFNPGLPLEEVYAELQSFLVELNSINGANSVHLGTIQLDGLARQLEELLHRVSVQQVLHLALVLEREPRGLIRRTAGHGRVIEG